MTGKWKIMGKKRGCYKDNLTEAQSRQIFASYELAYPDEEFYLELY